MVKSIPLPAPRRLCRARAGVALTVLALTVGAFLALGLLPEPALACAVCGAAKEQNRQAYVAMTWVLSFLPLVLIGGPILWLCRQARKREALAAVLTQPESVVR